MTTNDRVNVNQKRLINCHAVDVNQIMPLKYKWAWEHYLNGCANHWMPNEVPMGEIYPYYDYVLTRGGNFTPPLGTYRVAWRNSPWTVWAR